MNHFKKSAKTEPCNKFIQLCKTNSDVKSEEEERTVQHIQLTDWPTANLKKRDAIDFLGNHKRKFYLLKDTSPKMEFLYISLTNTRVFCSMIFTVPSTGGFYIKPYPTVILKIHTKIICEQENWSFSMNSIL
jgi:hypothetical protein